MTRGTIVACLLEAPSSFTIFAGRDSISDAFCARVSKLISLDALLLLRMTPPVVTWLSTAFAACAPATPFWGGGGSLA